MATRKSRTSASKPAKSHRGLKTAAAVAAIGLATYAATKALKTPRGKAIKKKAMTKGRKVVARARSAAHMSPKRAARRSAPRSR